MKCIGIVSLFLFMSLLGPGLAETLVIHGARIHTVSGAVHDPGTLVLRDGLIAAVGPEGEVAVPDGARLLDGQGRVIIPGLVDTHSHLGVYSRPIVEGAKDGNELTGPVQGQVRAMDSFNPFDPGIRMALAGGITTANIMPGSGNVIGGQTLYIKLRGNSAEAMQIKAKGVLGGLKMANGENPKRVYGKKSQAPGTRMKIAALQREAFVKARAYQAKWASYREKSEQGEDLPEPDTDLALQPLVEVLEKKRTVHFHTHRADDILSTLRLKEEFDFELVIQHGTEAYKIVDLVAGTKVPVSMTIIDSPGGKAEVVDLVEQCGRELDAAGVPVLINTDDPVTESRFFLRTAATALRGGLSEAKTLEAITLAGAKAMHLDHLLGSLEPGKQADFVVLDGPPFSVYTRVLETWIDGEKQFDLADAAQHRFQTGGFGLAGAVPESPAGRVRPLPPAARPALPAGRETADASSTELLVLAGRLYPAGSPPIDDAAIWIKDGRVLQAGPRAEVRAPVGLPILRAAVVTPGLIDAYSVVPLAGEFNIPADQDANEQSEPNQADLRVLDGFNPAEPLLRYLLQQGVTVVHACPGRANVIGGTSGVFRTHGRSAEEMAIRFPHSMLFNLGEVPKKTYKDKRPGTRMGVAALLRQALVDARNYRNKQLLADASKHPDPNLKLDALAAVLEGTRRALFTAQKAEDILTALRLIEEFELDGMLGLATEGFAVADALAEAGVPVLAHPAMQRVSGLETINTCLGNHARLADRGIPLALGSGIEGYVPKTRVVRWEAAMSMVYGLGRARALDAITLEAAKILGIDQDYGSVAPGKVADLVCYDGDPFEHATQVTKVLVDGEIVYDRAKRLPLPILRRMFLFSPDPNCCLDF